MSGGRPEDPPLPPLAAGSPLSPLSSEPEEAFRLRFCFLKKEEGESFGFWLRQESGNGGHIVRKVTPGGLAHRRGLQEGDRILEVNGAPVEGVEHFRVSVLGLVLLCVGYPPGVALQTSQERLQEPPGLRGPFSAGCRIGMGTDPGVPFPRRRLAQYVTTGSFLAQCHRPLPGGAEDQE